MKPSMSKRWGMSLLIAAAASFGCGQQASKVDLQAKHSASTDCETLGHRTFAIRVEGEHAGKIHRAKLHLRGLHARDDEGHEVKVKLGDRLDMDLADLDTGWLAGTIHLDDHAKSAHVTLDFDDAAEVEVDGHELSVPTPCEHFEFDVSERQMEKNGHAVLFIDLDRSLVKADESTGDDDAIDLDDPEHKDHDHWTWMTQDRMAY